MFEQRLKASIKAKKEKMTEQRFREIQATLQSIKLNRIEILAYLEIDEIINRTCDDHQFAEQTTKTPAPDDPYNVPAPNPGEAWNE